VEYRLLDNNWEADSKNYEGCSTPTSESWYREIEILKVEKNLDHPLNESHSDRRPWVNQSWTNGHEGSAYALAGACSV
jgi:hypothetical protein